MPNRIDIKPVISKLQSMREKLHALGERYWEANGNAVSGDYVTIMEMWGKLNDLTTELELLDQSLEIQESQLSDPNTPTEVIPRITERYQRNIERAERLNKSAERLLPKAESLYNSMKDGVPSKKTTPKTSTPATPAPTPQKTKPTPKIAVPKSGNLIDDVFSGKTTRHSLPVDYYRSTRSDLMGAVKRGIGNRVGFEDLYENLQLNAQAFSAAKTYNLVRDLEAVKNHPDYQEKAKAIVKRYDTWADAEINTAQQQTHQAKQWQIITEDSDLFPILKYSTIGDACKICRPLDGLTAPVNSPIWKKGIYPCNHYGCYCIVTQETAGTELTESKRLAQLVAGSIELMNPVFLCNPGITQQLFINKHPYFSTVPKADRAFAKENFGLPIK